MPDNIEKIVENKSCNNCGDGFAVTDKDIEFYDKLSPVFDDKKINIPSPSLCPDCRQKRRVSFRNERKLYKRKCDLSGKNIISIYSPDKDLKVYNWKDWQSDKWDAYDYSLEYSFERSFFEQYSELLNKVPKKALYIDDTMSNTDYANYGLGCKNSFLVFNSYESENCYYSSVSVNNNYDVDSISVQDTEHSYMNVFVNNSRKIFFSGYSDRCENSIFLYDCKDCKNCLGCSGLQNKNYYILNKEVSKDEFEAVKNKILTDRGFFEDFKNKFYDLKNNSIVKYNNSLSTENSVGDFLINCKDCFECFNMLGTENAKYCWESGYFAQNMYDCINAGDHSDYILEANACHKNYKSAFMSNTNESKNSYYLFDCQNLENCFGCVGLKNKSHCIFNKQYSEEDYNQLVPKIIKHMQTTGEWGEFFPSSISPFGYNETVANEYFPLNKGEAIDKGFNWSDYEAPFPNVDKIIPANKLPDDIDNIPDDILNWAIECEITKKPFRIIKQELEFYRKHNLPIPRRHPDQRHLDRMKLRNPRKLYTRTCDKDGCNTQIQTTYSPDRTEIVYCEKCYEKEVY